VTSQPPRAATSTQQRSGEPQRLKVGVGRIGQPPKVGEVVNLGADLWDRGQHSNLNCPSLLGGKLWLKANTAASW
jgi:hypothetical protein